MSKVIVLGASCVDVIVTPVEKSVFDTGHYHAESIRYDYGGDALNEAVVLSNCGIETQLITHLCADEAGKGMISYLKENGVDLSASKVPGEGQTYTTVILVTPDGERNLIGTKSGSLREFSLEDIPEELDKNAEIVSFASLFISHKLSREDYVSLFRNIKAQGKVLVTDTTTVKHQETASEYREVLSEIDYFLPNSKEAMLFTQQDSVESAAEELHACGVGHVVIKDGKNGCYLKDDEHDVWIRPEHIVIPMDTTGAGDSFAAGLIRGLLEKKKITEALREANTFGERAVASYGGNSWSKNRRE